MIQSSKKSVFNAKLFQKTDNYTKLTIYSYQLYKYVHAIDLQHLHFLYYTYYILETGNFKLYIISTKPSEKEIKKNYVVYF